MDMFGKDVIHRACKDGLGERSAGKDFVHEIIARNTTTILEAIVTSQKAWNLFLGGRGRWWACRANKANLRSLTSGMILCAKVVAGDKWGSSSELLGRRTSFHA
jgi:hypothetical protein